MAYAADLSIAILNNHFLWWWMWIETTVMINESNSMREILSTPLQVITVVNAEHYNIPIMSKLSERHGDSEH